MVDTLQKTRHPNPIIRIWAERRLKHMVTLCGDLRGKIILDAACGTALEARLMLVQSPDLVVALDIDGDTLGIAEKEFLSDNFKTCIGDVLDIKFQDGYFDVVLAGCILPHLPKPFEALQEFARVTREGGKIVINCGNDPEIYFLKRIIPFGSVFFRGLSKGLAFDHLYYGSKEFIHSQAELVPEIKLVKEEFGELNTQYYAVYEKVESR